MELGRLMALSHDGDRVSRERDKKPNGGGMCHDEPCRAGGVKARIAGPQRSTTSRNLSGAYACSLPEIDRIVDLAERLPGVEGAQLAGAGLGGCVMVLVQKTHTGDVLRALKDTAFTPKSSAPSPAPAAWSWFEAVPSDQESVIRNQSSKVSGQ